MSDDSRIKLHFMNDVCWSRFRTTYAKGSVFINEQLFAASQLAEILTVHSSFEDFVSALRELNGFFAVVQITDGSVFLAVDHVRSLPLFYAVRRTEVFVSDDAHWIREQVRDEEEVDELSVAEFLLTRSVSGRDTLLRSVKQVQAGEAVALIPTSEGVRMQANRFYEFDHAQTTQPFEELMRRSDLSLTSAFRRLTAYAAGKTIVVPLGGGLDSRLIMLMLKRTGYDKVVSFTYGRPTNQESEISRKVASELGFSWIFIPYSNDLWRDWYKSKQWSEYSRFANGLCSTPHLQDWPAVWELKRKELVPPDSIFVPGHLPAPNDVGHRLPVEWLNERNISVDEMASEICKAYCTLQDWPSHKTLVEPELIRKIESILRPPAVLTPKQAIDYFDRWSWESSWAKFMINSVRVYEFWGYRWWLPLWDLEFVHFWRNLPFELRFEKRFERIYVRKLETGTTGKPAITDTSKDNLGPALVTTLKKLHLHSSARRIRARHEYDRHHFAWYGLIPEDDYKRAFHGQENINTYLANQTIKNILPNYRIPEGLDILPQSSDAKSQR